MTTNVQSQQDPLHSIVLKSTSVMREQSRFGEFLSINNHAASAKLSLFGGHLLSFVPKSDGRERLWLSEKAVFDNHTPIRGGVPICWPWFGPNKRDTKAPNHGFVRNQRFELTSIEEERNAQTHVVNTRLKLRPTYIENHNTLSALKLELEINIGHACEITLITTNSSEDKNIPLSQAIHTYFSVEDIHKVALQGIEQAYYDKIKNTYNNPSPIPYVIVGETDRVHLFKQDASTEMLHKINIIESAASQTQIEQHGHNATVVWNPWEKRSANITDMDDDGYKNMLCIEAATEPEVLLKPKKQCVLTQRFY